MIQRYYNTQRNSMSLCPASLTGINVEQREIQGAWKSEVLVEPDVPSDVPSTVN